MSFKFSRRSEKRMIGVDNRLVSIAHNALKISSVDFGVAYLGGFRTAEQQKTIFDAGASKLDGIHGISEHQKGLALDLIPYKDGTFRVNDEDLYYRIAEAMVYSAMLYGQRIRWGGHWQNFRDFAHWELW
jgi:peptidoglycan LD-endopeptidase CwlK